MHPQAVTLRRDFAIDLRVLGVASSKTMLLGERGVDLENWREGMNTQGKPLDIKVGGWVDGCGCECECRCRWLWMFANVAVVANTWVIGQCLRFACSLAKADRNSMLGSEQQFRGLPSLPDNRSAPLLHAQPFSSALCNRISNSHH